MPLGPQNYVFMLTNRFFLDQHNKFSRPAKIRFMHTNDVRRPTELSLQDRKMTVVRPTEQRLKTVGVRPTE